MEEIKAVIIDDEPDAITFLKAQMSRLKTNIESVVFTKPQQALSYKYWAEVDLLFLDMEMPNMTGFEFLDELGAMNFHVIMTTAHDKYGIGAIKRGVLDYLLKPVDINELEEAVAKVKSLRRNNVKDGTKRDLNRICIPTTNGFDIVKLSDLAWLEASNNYTYVHLLEEEKPLLVSKSMRTFQNKLDPARFVRVNRSVIINIDFAVSFDKRNGNSVILSNQKEFTVSPTYREAFLESFTKSML